MVPFTTQSVKHQAPSVERAEQDLTNYTLFWRIPRHRMFSEPPSTRAAARRIHIQPAVLAAVEGLA